jgi:hypothetical protein
MGNPLKYIDLKGDSVRVYTETNSYGHSWMSVGEGDDMVVYSYGRYNGTNKGRQGINSSNGASNGDGVLLRLTGDEAKAYMAKKGKDGYSTFTIADVEDSKVSSALDERFNSSTEMPDRGDYADNPSAHIIDEYQLTENNCTTFVSDILNLSGSSVLKTTQFLPTNFGVGASYPITKRFVLPAALQNYLNRSSRPNSVVYRRK